MAVKIKRVYDAAEESDGYRVLVDRLWPRGLSKNQASVDAWLKDIAPSTELRTWFHHEPRLWEEFRSRYRGELEHNGAVAELASICRDHDVVTLLYGARDEVRNQAVVIVDYLG